MQSRLKYYKITSMHHPNTLSVPAHCTLTYSLRAFQGYGECCGGHRDLGGLDVTKQNQQITFFHREKNFLLLKPNIWGSSILPLGRWDILLGMAQLITKTKAVILMAKYGASIATIIKKSIKSSSAFTPYPLF